MIYINGEATSSHFPSLAEAVASITSAPSGIAAALNDRVIPRTQWEQTTLSEGDRIEIVTAVQGG